MAANRTRVLLSCYRTGEAEDPGYVAAIAASLAAYPEAVINRVTDPRCGLPARSKWLPTVFDVHEACEAEMAPIYAEQRRELERARTRSILAGERPPGAREVPKEIRELQAMLGAKHRPAAVLDVRNAPTPEAAAAIEKRILDDLAATLARHAAQPVKISAELAQQLAVASEHSPPADGGAETREAS